MRVQILLETTNFSLFSAVFHIFEDGSEIELKHCVSSKTSVKSSRKYFVHLNWLNSSIGRVGSIPQMVERQSSNPKMRVRIPLKTTKFCCSLQCQINMNLVRPKIWIRIPFLGKQGKYLVKNLLKKIQRNLTQPVKFVVIYVTKKVSYFLYKNKIPNSLHSNIVYKCTCPGCNSYIGKTERNLAIRFSEHSDPLKSSIF